MYSVIIRQRFLVDITTLFNTLADHQRLGQITGATIHCIQAATDGTTSGVGSVRVVKKPLTAPFEETIITFVPDQLIEYQITRGSPLSDHIGRMQFSRQQQQTLLHYQIDFNPKWPVPGWGWLLKQLIHQPIAAGLKRYALSFER